MLKLANASNINKCISVTKRIIGPLNGDLVPEVKIGEEKIKIPSPPLRCTHSSLSASLPKGQLFVQSGGIGGNICL